MACTVRVMFCLWGHLKSRVLPTIPYTSPVLKNCIRNEFATIPNSMIRIIMANIAEGFETCVVWISEGGI